jgi:hypothetical protein
MPVLTVPKERERSNAGSRPYRDSCCTRLTAPDTASLGALDRRLCRLTRLADRCTNRVAQLDAPESFFQTRFSTVTTPITWSRSANRLCNRSIALICSALVPRAFRDYFPPLIKSPGREYNVCPEIPARCAICAAVSYLLSKCTTSCIRSSVPSVDFRPVGNLSTSTLQLPLIFLSRETRAIQLQKDAAKFFVFFAMAGCRISFKNVTMFL